MALKELIAGGLGDRLGRDPEFTLHARAMTGRIRFTENDVPAFILHMVDGTVARIDIEPTPFDGFELQLAGDSDQWNRLLSPDPEPFYQDWFPAMVHHGFRLEGDFGLAMAYYPALVRLRQILVSTREGQPA